MEFPSFFPATGPFFPNQALIFQRAFNLRVISSIWEPWTGYWRQWCIIMLYHEGLTSLFIVGEMMFNVGQHRPLSHANSRNCKHNKAGFSESNEGENDSQILRSRDNMALPCEELNLHLGKPSLSVALFPPMEQSFNPVLACTLNFHANPPCLYFFKNPAAK